MNQISKYLYCFFQKYILSSDCTYCSDCIALIHREMFEDNLENTGCVILVYYM